MDLSGLLKAEPVRWWTILTLKSGEVVLVTDETWLESPRDGLGGGGYAFPNYEEADRAIRVLERPGILRRDTFLMGVGPEDLPPDDVPRVGTTN